MFFLHRKIITVLILFHLGILFSGGKVSHFLPLSTLKKKKKIVSKLSCEFSWTLRQVFLRFNYSLMMIS